MDNTFKYGQRYFGADVPIGQVIREQAVVNHPPAQVCVHCREYYIHDPNQETSEFFCSPECLRKDIKHNRESFIDDGFEDPNWPTCLFCHRGSVESFCDDICERLYREREGQSYAPKEPHPLRFTASEYYKQEYD